jgi:PIN domain
MSDRVVLVDFENVHKVDLGLIPGDSSVMVFFGAAQKSVTRDYHKAARHLGDRCEEIDIHGHGRNALDFHIAFYLGERLARQPSAELIILSKDKGFDPLIEHLRDRKFNVRRESELTDAVKARLGPQSRKATLQALIDMLRKTQKARPATRKKLLAHVAAHFKGSTTSEHGQLIDQLVEQGYISEPDGRLEYAVKLTVSQP